MDKLDFVRGELATARLELGRIAQIARDTKIDRRTVLGVLGGKKVPHAATVDTLAVYFKRLNKEKTK